MTGSQFFYEFDQAGNDNSSTWRELRCLCTLLESCKLPIADKALSWYTNGLNCVSKMEEGSMALEVQKLRVEISLFFSFDEWLSRIQRSEK